MIKEMKKEMLFTARTVEQALGEAALKLGLDTDKLEYEVIEREKAGFFGIGSVPAKIKVFVETVEKEVETVIPNEEISNTAKKADEVSNEDSEEAVSDNSESLKEVTSEITANDVSDSVSDALSEDVVENVENSKPKENTEHRACKDHVAKEFIENLLKNLEIDANVEMTRVRKSDRAITVTGEDAGILIGHHGDTLDALQYLANLAANKREEDESRDYVHITVDIEKYRSKRETSLRTLARRISEKVQRTGEPVMLEPMNPYERRIIHSEVQLIDGVSTNSVGEDSDRRVVIYLESAGFSIPENHQRNDRRKPGRPDRRSRSDSRSRNDRSDRRERQKNNNRPQPKYNDGEKMSTEEVNELVAAYGAKDTKEKNQREQPAKFKSFEDYMNSILGEEEK